MAFQRKGVFALTGGMISEINPILLQDGQAKLLLNYNTEQVGAWTKRDGYQLYGQQIVAGKPILGMHQFTNFGATSSTPVVAIDDATSTNSDIHYLAQSLTTAEILSGAATIPVVDETLFEVSGTAEVGGEEFTYTGVAAGTLTGVTGITQTNASGSQVRQWRISLADDTAGARPQFETFMNRVFRFNGVDAPTSSTDPASGTWDTGITGQLRDAPNGTLVASFLANLYVAGNTTTPDRLFFSKGPDITGTKLEDVAQTLIDPPVFDIQWDTTLDYIDINPNDNSNIVALERNQNLLIFKERGLYRINSAQQTEADLLVDIGALSKDVVTTLRGVTTWIGRSREDLSIFAYTGGFPKDIGTPIQRWINAIDQSNLDQLHVQSTRDLIWYYLADSMTLDGESFENVYAIYSLSRNDWCIYSMADSFRANDLFVIEDNSERLFAGNNDGQTFRMNFGRSDDGRDIPGRVIAKEFSLTAPEIDNRLQNFAVFADNARGTNVKIKLTNGETVAIGDINTRFAILDAPPDKVQSFTFQPIFTDNSTRKSQINGFAFWFEPGEDLTKFDVRKID